MTTYKSFILVLLTCLPAGVMAAQSPAPTVTLDQAVAKVRQDTGGTVLSAEPRRIGRRLEYRIKVLTPQGHVKVLAVSSEPDKNSPSSQSNQNQPARAGSKEKR